MVHKKCFCSVWGNMKDRSGYGFVLQLPFFSWSERERLQRLSEKIGLKGWVPLDLLPCVEAKVIYLFLIFFYLQTIFLKKMKNIIKILRYDR